MCMGGGLYNQFAVTEKLVIAEPTIIFKITQIKYSEWGIKII